MKLLKNHPKPKSGVDVSDFKWRDDVLLKVLDAMIDAALKDEFIQFAIAFDHDNNNYLKKQELEDVAKAWNEREQSSDDEDEFLRIMMKVTIQNL